MPGRISMTEAGTACSCRHTGKKPGWTLTALYGSGRKYFCRKNGPAGKSNVGHLYLYEKIPGPVVIPPEPWKIVDGGAWGRMVYNLSGSEFDFVFNGHELAMGVGYTLIYYPDPWPGIGLKILGSGIADEGGDVHIKGKVATGDLPIAGDLNIEYGGAKIWLVLSDDLGPEGWRGWNPTEYLFENSLINFDGTP